VSPNLRQVHLLHSELLSALEVPPGDLGENVTTAGIDLLSLSTGTRLRLGSDAVVELTGLRNPCKQIERYQEGLLAKVLLREEDGSVTRLMGVMAVVLRGGAVRAGDAIAVEAPSEHLPLAVV
jgi:MOSC domain-containing protein YiiM